MTRRLRRVPTHAIALLATLSVALVSCAASAHGFAGKRFFPATLATDDPFVSDELSLPTITQLPYLQSFVKDVGLGAPFDRMIPLMEVALATPWIAAAAARAGRSIPACCGRDSMRRCRSRR